MTGEQALGVREPQPQGTRRRGAAMGFAGVNASADQDLPDHTGSHQARPDPGIQVEGLRLDQGPTRLRGMKAREVRPREACREKKGK